MTVHPRHKAFTVIGLAALALILGIQRIRPFPFTTTDDNWMYFLPLIKAHTDALLRGEFLQVLWSLGSGWVPWENAQVGVFYLPYHLANLLSRLIGHPLALLEVSAWLHLGAAGLVAHEQAPPERSELERLSWGLVAMLAPGPLLLGLNWHNYLSCYPWFLALAFQLQRIGARPDTPIPQRARVIFGICSLGFFLSAHAQMYVLGIGLLVLWSLASHPRRQTFRVLRPFLLAQAAAIVPLVYLKVLSLGGTPDWMGDRGDPNYLLRHAQTLAGVLHGVVFGNLLATRDFQLWADISWTGVGMFFTPALVLLGPDLWRNRRWLLGLFFLGALVFMGAASFPWIRHLGVGPLEGFRWTWKVSIFIGPLALVTLLNRLDAVLPRRGALVAGGMVLLSLCVFLRGLSFEIWPSLSAAHPLGAERLVAETRSMAQATGLPPGTRIVVAGPFDMVQPLPLPVLGLVGNAPILAGLETAQLYEPMEPAWASQDHMGLSLPWRVALSAPILIERTALVMSALRSIGVQAVITIEPKAANLPGASSFTDSLGRKLWVVPVPGGPTSPYPAAPGQALTRLPSGTLLASRALPPPVLLSHRALTWRPAQATWRGEADGFPMVWAIATLTTTLMGYLALLWKQPLPRHDAPERQPPDATGRIPAFQGGPSADTPRDQG